MLELDIHAKLVQYIKLAEVATGLGTEAVRAPRLPLSGAEREKVLKIINDALAVRPELPAGSWGNSLKTKYEREKYCSLRLILKLMKEVLKRLILQRD